MQTRNPAVIRSIVKASQAIDRLAAAQCALSLTALSREMGISKSTLHGILSTLLEIGYVAQEPESGKYRLGVKLFELGNCVSNQWDMRRIAYPFIQRVAESTGETVHMAVLSEGEVLYINKQESARSLRIVTTVGARLPAHCTGLGKVLLAGLSRPERLRILREKGMARHTDFTLTDGERFEREMEAVRAQGYAVDEQEFMEGLRCVAAPIHDHRGSVAAALSVSGPLSRMRDGDFEQKRSALMEAAREISKQLGYGGDV